MTRTRAPASTAVSVAAIAMLAALGGCSRDAVEPKLVGSWQTAIASPAGPYQLRFTTSANGEYQTDSQGPAPAPPETGSLKAIDGKWRLDKLTGSSDEGTYQFVSADKVLFKSKTETLLWSRVPKDAAAATVQLAAASPSVAPAGGTGAGAGAAPLTAGLLAAGPFGPPLPQAAAAVAPQSPTSASPFGAAVAPPPQQSSSTAGATGPPPSQSVQAGGIGSQQTPRNVQRTAQQSVSQSAAATSDAVNGAATEADKKVGQRIKHFAGNAGSKIKHFFTGAKQGTDDDNGSAAPAP